MSETYDIGEVSVCVANLRERYQAVRELRRVIVDRPAADLVYEFDYPAAPPVTWDWLNDPQKRLKWEFAERRMFPFLLPSSSALASSLTVC